MINEVKILYDYALRRNKASGRYTIPQFNEMLDLAQNNVIKDQVEEKGIEAYLSDADKSVKLIKDSTIAIASGIFPYPNDYLYLDRLSHVWNDGGTNRNAPIDILRSYEFDRRANSSLEGPTDEFPIGEYAEGGFKVIPYTISSVKISYLKRPEKPVWGFTVVNDVEVYDSNSSTDLVLHEGEKNKLVYELLTLSGVRLKMSDIRNYSTQIKESE